MISMQISFFPDMIAASKQLYPPDATTVTSAPSLMSLLKAHILPK